MSIDRRPILVFGATGQQGGSVASALLKAGWRVRAFVRNPRSSRAVAFRDAGAELVEGDLADTRSLQAAMKDLHGVFSVQPSSGQGTMYGVSDEDEVRYGIGIGIAEIAAENGVRHLVYSSTNTVGGEPTGMGHFDSKARIEARLEASPAACAATRRSRSRVMRQSPPQPCQ